MFCANILFLVVYIDSNLLYAQQERIKAILLILIGNIEENEKGRIEANRTEPN